MSGVDARQRVQELCENFERYADAFEKEFLFTGPSLYFHKETLNIQREHRGSVVDFMDSMYATLKSGGCTGWGREMRSWSSIRHSSSPSAASKTRCAA